MWYWFKCFFMPTPYSHFIMENSKNMKKDDLVMIQNQTGASPSQAEEAYVICQQDAVQTILYILSGGDTIKAPPASTSQKEDPIQQKLAEFRNILNKKDHIFDIKVLNKSNKHQNT